MKNALIDPTVVAQQVTGYIQNPDPNGRKWLPVMTPIANSAVVAQVDDTTFEVAEPLFWVQCADDVVAYQWYYDTTNQQIIVIPPAPPYPVTSGVASV